MNYENWKRTRELQWEPVETEESIARNSVSPGKRTLTMSLAPRSASALASVQVPVQQKTDPAAVMRRKEQTAFTEHWMDVAFRPDLYDAPIQRKSTEHASDQVSPELSAGNDQPTPSHYDPGGQIPRIQTSSALLDEAMAESAAPVNPDLRSRAESSLGIGFGDVHVHHGPAAHELTSQRDAMALTYRDHVFLGPSVQNSLNPVLAHELSHVAQQRMAPGNVHAAAKLEDDNDSSAQEREADTAAAAILIGQSASVTPAASPRLAGFAPGHHREATVRGLSHSFAANEIAAIYNANWERDFAQGAPKIASAVLAWKAVKRSASQNNGQPDPALAASFRNAIWDVVDMDVTESLNESFGGCQYWQHMDQPDEDVAHEANQRWGQAANDLAGYIADSKAYIKDHMVAAVDLFRSTQGRSQVGEGIDNWNGAARPEGYVAPEVQSEGGTTSTHLPAGWSGPGVASREPLAAETADMAESQGARSGSFANARDERLWTVVGQHIGRAMHAFEDFWAHSNWLELAQELKAGERESVSNGDLETGTFGMASKVHALGHKLSAFADALLGDFDLLLQIYERTEASTALDPNDRRPAYMVIDTDSEDAFDGLWAESSTLSGEFLDIVRATNAMEEMVQSGDFDMADFLCNRDYLMAVRDKGQRMIEHGASEADDHAHGSIAKDQEEEGKDHAGAMSLAAEANERVFGPLRNIMEMDDQPAQEALLAQLELVEQMIAAPSRSHPLWHVIEPMGDWNMPRQRYG